ncbi:ankyrin repeat domain-containing protein [Streptomyces sp. NPDC048659]|uniref:ankyrin repeat domain-containing protein n=1 Tax=Streptomyces sp. NPDC048659 TaxID=3155489 RepID=UPI00341D8A99
MESFIAAVRAGNTDGVHELLKQGADPDIVDEHGTPMVTLAVEAFDTEMLGTLLMRADAVDLERVDAGGRTPLMRAIELGDPDVVYSLLAEGARLEAEDAEGRDALALARYWHERDIEAEVRRRSGGPGPVRRRVIHSESPWTCEELSLGDVRFRTGRSAVLTDLEPRCGVAPSFDELLSRVLAEPNVDHAVWGEASIRLAERRDWAVWDSAAALRGARDPLERYIGAEVLRTTNLFDESDETPFDGPLVDLFLPWVVEEEDHRVVWSLTAGLTDTADPQVEPALPRGEAVLDALVRPCEDSPYEDLLHDIAHHRGFC